MHLPDCICLVRSHTSARNTGDHTLQCLAAALVQERVAEEAARAEEDNPEEKEPWGPVW
jgi:hypothetical protein